MEGFAFDSNLAQGWCELYSISSVYILCFYPISSKFSTVFSVAVLASAAMAAPQYYYPAAPQYYYNGAVAQPAAGAALGYAVSCLNLSGMKDYLSERRC